MKTPKTGQSAFGARAGRAARLPLAEVRTVLARQEASRLSLSAFGRQEGIPCGRLANYRRCQRLEHGTFSIPSTAPVGGGPTDTGRVEPAVWLSAAQWRMLLEGIEVLSARKLRRCAGVGRAPA